MKALWLSLVMFSGDRLNENGPGQFGQVLDSPQTCGTYS
jgi:hypothetical protein